MAVSLVGGSALSISGAAGAADGRAGARRFEHVVHDFYEHYLAAHPEEATQLGDHRFDRRTSDVSAAGVAADRALYRRTLATPPDWSPERVASQYREDNSAMLRDITAHEAMPGHYLQGAAANAIRYPTLVRAMVGSGTFAEGWAVYAEQIMAEAGFGGDETKLQQLKIRLRVAINAILDQKMHAGDMSEQEAMHLMMDVGYQEEGEAAGKWRRAEMSAGQLSTYFVGIQEMNALAADMQAKTGGDMQSVRDAMLAHGTIATKYVRQLAGLPPAAAK